MKNRILSSTFAALVIALSITACGGGGGSAPATTALVQPVAPVVPVVQAPVPVPDKILATMTIAQNVGPWFHTQQVGPDGNESLVLTTIDAVNYRGISDATPMYIIKSDDTGVTDATSQFFDVIPKTFWSRNLVSYKDDNGNQALYVCNQGRETTSPTSSNGANGVWAEQDRVFVMHNGKYVDESSKLPQVIDFTHGCDVANLGDGKKTLVKNALGTNNTKALLQLTGVNYEVTGKLDTVYKGTADSFAVAAADFTKTGTDDVIFSNAVIRKSGSTYSTAYNIDPPADYKAAGYTVVHNLVATDLNGDGYPDLLVSYSGDGKVAGGPSFLSGAKLAVYINDKAGNLVLKEGAIPQSNETEYGLSLRVIDVNFDGKVDIVTSGSKYQMSNLTNPTDFTVRSILINNGDGTFTKKSINDPALDKQCASECQTQIFYLKNADGSFNIVAYGKNKSKTPIFYGRKVTKDQPLILQ